MGIRLILSALAFILVLMGYSQQEEKSEVGSLLGVDLATSYLWRGIPQGKAPAIQPYGELTYKGFAAGAWGSTEFTGEFNEIDLYARYTLKTVSLQFMDMFFPGDPGLNQDYFDFRNSSTGHAGEVGLSYNGTESFPLSAFAGTFIYGKAVDPAVKDTAHLNHSVYAEVSYLLSRKETDFNFFAGFTPFSSVLYGTDRFSLINLGFTATKTIQVTEHFSVPLELTLAANPASNKLHLAAIFSF